MKTTGSHRKLRVGIDLTGAWRPRTGIFGYSIEIARHLLLHSRQFEYTLFFGGEIHPEFVPLRGAYRPIIIPLRDELLSKQLFMSFRCNSRSFDVLHFPAFPPPVACMRPLVWTLHDATPWLYPKTMDLKGRLYFQYVGRLAARFSKAIITVSNDAKRDILNILRVQNSKVEVIYEGVDPRFKKLRDKETLSAVRERYGLPERFILAVGTIEPRKNLPFLIDTYARFRKISSMDIGLVIAGRTGWNSETVELKGEGVILTGFVPLDDLVALYNLADVFVLPSLHEGFGLPPLEAMASGCPVIVSHRGSLPEVVGNAGLLIDPEDAESLCAALNEVLTCPGKRLELIERGYARVKDFSWTTAAMKTAEVLERAAFSQ